MRTKLIIIENKNFINKLDKIFIENIIKLNKEAKNDNMIEILTNKEIRKSEPLL